MCVYIILQQEISPISLFDANIGTETTAVIDRATAKPAEARTIYAKEYVDGNRYLAAASYDRAFNKYYEAGKKGMSFSDIKRSSRDIKADSARRIYEAGRRATENESKRQSKYKQTAEYKSRSEARTEANTKAKKKGGVIRSYAVDKKISRLQRQQLRVLDEWARQEGITIRVVESLSEKIKLEGKVINGRYDGGNVITIALDGKNMLTSTAGHELYHMIKELAPEHAEAFRAFVVDHLKEAGEYDSVFGDYERRYKNTYKVDESFKAKIEEEIVADHCFEALTNKKQWEKFAGEHKSIAEKIIDFIREFVAKINNAFDKYFVHDNAYIRDSVIGEVEYMNKIADMLWEGVDKAVENYRSGTVNKSGETKYQLVGETPDGIEVYETSQGTLNKSLKERKKAYLDLVRNEYAGRTARFVRNGHTYYAEFDRENYSKPIYGEKHNSNKGYKALIRAGADGDVFDLVENSQYTHSSVDTKNHKAKDGFTDYFDYFVKTIQIDGQVYDLTATVKKQYGVDNGFTYSLFLKDNKKTKATPTKNVKTFPQSSGQPLNNITVTQGNGNVNTHSMQNSGENSPLSISEADYSGNGYDGYSMSNNARSAYENGEMPISKWSKSEIIRAISEIDNKYSEKLKKVPLSRLRAHFLEYTSWHHTSSKYNRTNFYTISENAVNELSDQLVDELSKKENNENSEKPSWMSDDEWAYTQIQAENFSQMEKLRENLKDYEADVKITEFKGKHPYHKVFKDAKVTEKGNWYVITTNDGDTFKKKISGNYIQVTNKKYSAFQQQVLEQLKTLEDERKNNQLDYRRRNNEKYWTERLNEGKITDDAIQWLNSIDYDAGFSRSGNVYDNDHYPTPTAYENGLENFFEKGERRLRKEGENYKLEEWNGTDWSPNIRYSVSDADYLAAAESGDEKTAAEMVKKAAEEAFKDSIIRDDDGNLLKVYHGRVSEFNIFDREFASIEGDMGKGFYFSSQEDDVDSNYANVEGPDLTNKIARLAERIEAEQDIDYDEAKKKAREQYIKSEPNTVEAYLNVKNPAIISNDSDGTYLEYNENYDEEADEYGDPEGSLVDFVEALELAAKDYESFRPVNFWEALGESIYDGEISLKDAISLLKENIFDELSDENGDFAINEVIRQAIEDIGFDGIIDKTVSEKFTNMQGMYSDTTYYIVFDSSQIKSADPITYDNDGNIIPLSERFNENEKDIRYQISENAEKDVQALLEGKKFTEDIKLTDSSPRIILGHKGVRNLPMLMKPIHILENILTTEEAKRRGLEIDPEKIHYHGLGKTRFFNIIRGLDNVNQAYRGTKNAANSSRRENYFLLISTLKDAEGNVINVPVYINEHGQWHNVEIKVNKIGTVFGREQLQRYIQKEIKNGNLVRIKKRSSLVGELAGDKVPTSYGEATSRGGSEVSEKPTTKADDYYSIASDNSIHQSNEKSQEKFSQISIKFLTDETKTSISDAGMRLTDDSELSSLLREQAYKEEIERLKGELVKSKRMGGKGKNRLVQADISRIARDIISEYSSKIDFSTLRDELTGLYELMDNIEIQGSADYAELVKLSNDIAKSVIASSYVDITDQSAEKYKAAMRSYRLTPSLQDVAELKDMFGTFGAAYRQYGRKLNMRAQGTPGALHIDEVWEDLCDSVPFLDRDAVSTQDMWRNLIEVRDSLDEKNGFNPYITDGDLTANEAAGALGADILERFNEVRADTTFADRAQQRVDLRFPIVVMRIKIFSLTGCSDIINPSPNRTLSRNPLTARPTAHTLVLHDIKQCKQVYQQQCMMHKIVFVCKRCGLKAHSGRTRSHL